MFQLNLRQKMLGGFILQLIFYTVLGVSVFKDFEKFNLDVNLLIHSIRLSNICLEIRRYEKNFIIRHDEQDYRTAEKYSKEAFEYLAVVRSDLKTMPEPEHLQKIASTLYEYRTVFKKLNAGCGGPGTDDRDTCRSIAEIGKELIRLTDEFVLYHQMKLNNFKQHFIRQLCIYLVLHVTFTLVTTILIFRSFVNPLKSIEDAADTIAQGTFTTLPVPDKKDELHRVLCAFNRMVTELERQQEQLFQAKKLSSIGTLASGTAHQLNNPLNNISTSCQIARSELREGDLDFIEHLLENIELEAQRAGETVRSLLEFSRAQTFSIQPVLLDDVLNRVLNLVASYVPSGVTVKKDIPSGLTLNLDVQKMTEALLNILMNSIQAISEPPGSITITALIETEDDLAVITVEDTGCGIDEEEIQKIFDPFYTTKNIGEGTGLGLAVVYGIIEKHKGSIRVESVKGEGARFIISLPLSHERANPLDLAGQQNVIPEQEKDPQEGS